ncbi:MAG: glycoside hydrolase family 32 protein, partial [Chloroflexota bacterium]
MGSPDRYRPQYHFTPPQNWMNDPNGLLYHGGEYHLYYQHNPYGTAWGHMSWGHATSPNLVHWTRLPVALAERPDRGYTVFSGSAVVDAANTSGLGCAGQAPWVAVYTADYRDGQGREDIHIAFSLDRGRTFTEYDGNPVLRVDERKFGDPKVFWHAPGGRWILVAILGAPQGRVVLHGSPNLRDWSRLSEFEAPAEAPGVWECPDLFPLHLDGDPQREQWVLKVNHVSRAVGHATRYFVGAFDGVAFRPTHPALRPRPDDDPLYAEVTYNGIPPADGRRILFGWLRQTPRDARAWTGAQSIPRVLSLRSGPGGPQLYQAPAAELQYLRRHPRTLADLRLSGEAPLFDDGLALGGEYELILT